MHELFAVHVIKKFMGMNPINCQMMKQIYHSIVNSH